MVENGTPYDYPGTGMYIKGDQPIKLAFGNNLCYPTFAAAGLTDSARRDYHLLPSSPAINTGRDMSDFNLTTDFEGTPRPQQGKYDVGAYEFKGDVVANPPVANAGSNVTITLPVDSTTLDGTASTASAGRKITGYAWKKISGPAAGSIAAPNAAKASVTSLAAGTYIFELTVTDDASQTGTARVTVTVNPAANKPPVANAGSNIRIQLPVNTATLDGSASSDPDGQIVSWSWTKISGPAGGDISTASQSITTVINLVAGTYTYQLTVTDNAGASNSATVTVTVLPPVAPNKPPVANAGSNIRIQLPVNTATLDGSASTDPDGQIVSWSWTKLSGPAGGDISTASQSITTVINLAAGTYTYQLTVTDNAGASNSATVTVTVLPPVDNNQPPVAVTGGDVIIRLPVNFVVADGSASYDPDGAIAWYSWKQLSGPSDAEIVAPTAATTPIKSLIEGKYTFRLSVTDNKGAIGTTTFSVTVLPLIPVPHTSDSARVFPNPAVNTVRLDVQRAGTGPLQMRIFSISGKLQQETTYKMNDDFQTDIDISNWAPGLYIIELRGVQDKFLWKGRIVKVPY
jgi:hypothetical protein